MAPGGMTPSARMFKMLKENMEIKLERDFVFPKKYYEGMYEILRVQIFFGGSLVAEDKVRINDEE